MATFLAGKEEEARDSRAHRETWQRLKSKQKEMDVKVLVVYEYNRGFCLDQRLLTWAKGRSGSDSRSSRDAMDSLDKDELSI